MRLISSQSDKEVAAGRALERLGWPLRELTANLARITRGAGKPADLVKQLVLVINAIAAYEEASGRNPSEQDFRAILDRRIGDYATNPVGEWERAQEAMVLGALQIAASDLVGQATQRSVGHNQMFDGLMVIERIRESNRREVSRTAATTPKRKKRGK